MVFYMYLCSFGTWEMTTFWGGEGGGEGGVKRDLLFQNCPWTGLFDQRQKTCLNLGKTIFCGGSCVGPTTLPRKPPVYAGWNVKRFGSKKHTRDEDDDDRAQTYLPPKWAWKRGKPKHTGISEISSMFDAKSNSFTRK